MMAIAVMAAVASAAAMIDHGMTAYQTTEQVITHIPSPVPQIIRRDPPMCLVSKILEEDLLHKIHFYYATFSTGLSNLHSLNGVVATLL